VLLQLDGLHWAVLTLIPFVFLQRALHRALQAVFLLITRRAEIALAIFSLLFFPGVLLHEISHFLMAKILFVPTGGFSLIPRRTKDGRLLMGFVETAPTDILRDALIGAAPLLVGSAFVAFAGLFHLRLVTLWEALSTLELEATLAALTEVYKRPDFWLWFYLIVAVSSTMLPSHADRRTWLPVLLVIVLLVALAALVGAGPWMVANLAPLFNNALRALAIVLAISAAVHLVVLLPALLLQRLLSQALGLKVM
jgi:hypothetical protein